ncbi:hypothetical protein TSOC_002839 [Tetrabaena socialis]|uniref:Uncharacterized protein n=1 Tax=Tetrabaena socialis TaxID=47790 RepID=A0A2J8AD57_9CHLO|nr:hypothetical protein TSOC_002839 [Tetrabaena socialis]|eukprot:PNH10446.1 hypothetical protein TSOC_002839 [Tetrabaena socialis]
MGLVMAAQAIMAVGGLPLAAGRPLNGRLSDPTADVQPLFMMCRLAATPQEARIALSAFAAVRASLIRQGELQPFSEQLAVVFVHNRA